jgi:DNA-binding NarL/FixJ family response regulator
MSLRLMLVADDPLSASAVRRAVRATCAFQMPDGYADGRGPCGQIAVAQRPDVVVVDQMRSLDATIARISEVRTALPNVKIVLLPARMDPVWLSHAAAAGADAAIAKTLRLAGIGALVQEVAVGNVFHAFDAGPPPPRPAACGFLALT